jgi:hypothetical protein
MFVFYHIEDLILLERLQLLKLITDKGFKIYASQLIRGGYLNQTCWQVENIAQKGLIEIKEQDSSVYDFVEKYNEEYPASGRSLLALIHFCKIENYTLVLDANELIVQQLAEAFSVATCTLIDFYKDTIEDDKYIKFITELKKETLIK